jgi:3-oxoacyl-[acyl-carrier-protein] synthase II
LDAFEARGIAGVFGREIPVYAPLSRFGNMGGAARVVELLSSVLALKHGELPGTLNHDDPAADCPVDVYTGRPRMVRKHYAVKVTSTDLAQRAACVTRKWEE